MESWVNPGTFFYDRTDPGTSSSRVLLCRLWRLKKMPGGPLNEASRFVFRFRHSACGYIKFPPPISPASSSDFVTQHAVILNFHHQLVPLRLPVSSISLASYIFSSANVSRLSVLLPDQKFTDKIFLHRFLLLN